MGNSGERKWDKFQGKLETKHGLKKKTQESPREAEAESWVRMPKKRWKVTGAVNRILAESMKGV